MSVVTVIATLALLASAPDSTADALPIEDLDTDAAAAIIENGIWDDTRTVVAYTAPVGSDQGVFALVRLDNSSYKSVDLSAIRSGLFTKLGLASQLAYDSYKLKPMHWQETSDGHFLLMVQLRA